MPTFYEGNPISEAVFKITEEDFVKASYLRKTGTDFFKKREVRSGIFFSLILITALTIPSTYAKYGTFFTQAVFIFLFLICFYIFAFFEPEQIKKRAGEKYASNQFLKLENKAFIYRDSLVYENAYEKYSQYLTDFSYCIETEEMFILTGGERDILIIKKDGMDEDAVRKTSENFVSFFASKYIRSKKGYK